MRTVGNKYSDVYVGKYPIKNHLGKFSIPHFEKKFGDRFAITLYAIHGFGKISLLRREKNTFYIEAQEKNGSGGYQILCFPEGVLGEKNKEEKFSNWEEGENSA